MAGGRPTKHPDEKRSERFNLRFTVRERAHVETQAQIAGVQPAEYLRRRALGYTVPAAPTQRSDPALISELARIGNNVNQIARALHRGRDIPAYWREVGDELQQALAKVLDG